MTQSNKPLAGKVALVTGGARGIGEAIALRLAEDGADVAISYSASGARVEPLLSTLRSHGARAMGFKADQARPADVNKMVEDVINAFGQLDILVNNAAVYVMGSVLDAAAHSDALDHQFAVNVGGVAAAVRAAAPFMKDGGRIINIGSGAGSTSPFPNMADYAASKAAVAGYTRGWARDLGPKGITVNVIQPGPIATDMNPSEGGYSDILKKKTALGRYGQPFEIAAVVAFLARSDSGFVTGATIDVDGGMGA